MGLYEAANGPLPDGLWCGRPQGHNGPCRSVQALQRYRPSELARCRRRRRRQRIHAQLDAIIAAAVRRAA